MDALRYEIPTLGISHAFQKIFTVGAPMEQDTDHTPVGNHWVDGLERSLWQK